MNIISFLITISLPHHPTTPTRSMNITFAKGRPYTPLMQLLNVLPSQSGPFLPEPYRDLMVRVPSPLVGVLGLSYLWLGGRADGPIHPSIHFVGVLWSFGLNSTTPNQPKHATTRCGRIRPCGNFIPRTSRRTATGSRTPGACDIEEVDFLAIYMAGSLSLSTLFILRTTPPPNQKHKKQKQNVRSL